MTQLRNMINRRNVRTDISGRFNAAVDFFELVTNCHIIVAAMTFFGMTDLNSVPTQNTIPTTVKKWSKQQQWAYFSRILGDLVDRYIIVRDCKVDIPQSNGVNVQATSNKLVVTESSHVNRIALDHCYCNAQVLCAHKGLRRKLPRFLQQLGPAPQLPQSTKSDGVFSYACTVLCDGLLLLELCDAIHQGDGPRILRCWKFMLLYFKAYNHHKYALEAFNLLAITNGTGTGSALIKEQITWSRTVNSRGSKGKNIPVDLYNEHLNRTLKDSILGLGANVTKERIVDTSKSIERLSQICASADSELGIAPTSSHHTRHSSEKDKQLIIDELSRKSRVFEYVPGRVHPLYRSIEPCIAKTVDADKLIKWITTQKQKLKNDAEFAKFLNA